ncbi:C40 family peptidase [Pseudanabaena mucicola]|uniref:C40 family peptidase n=1 Tax=Pseudanabaena mucicola FACHB-723 TaxID=2692860 RepID=A0ABR7ZUK7_9CYAN|nr:C40 family peptidase [Pseudanabaena mucicola]MBD2187499.1 C40 family peptidase [Pseudanabaena mucicola FACHB-723]
MIYRSLADINIYDSPTLDRLATQMAKGRYLQVIEAEPDFWQIQLLEDGYTGLLDCQDVAKLVSSDRKSFLESRPPNLSSQEICDRISDVIAFIQTAIAVPNQYLWGGTVAPDYDCSGLMQVAFASVGIWLPRDAYQQEEFSDAIAIDHIQVGDLIFFGTPTKATHVGIYIGDAAYIHSSGKEHGHNGIAMSTLSGQDPVSQWYRQQLRGVGRITRCYNAIQPKA